MTLALLVYPEPDRTHPATLALMTTNVVMLEVKA
jgi:hypothetical protein